MTRFLVVAVLMSSASAAYGQPVFSRAGDVSARNLSAQVIGDAATVDGTPLATITAQAAAAMPLAQLSSSPFAVSGTSGTRSLAAHFNDVIDAADYALSGDANQTAAVTRAYVVAQNRMNLGQSVELSLPAGRFSATALPILYVPRGVNADIHGAGRGTVLYQTAAGNGVTVQVVAPGAAPYAAGALLPDQAVAGSTVSVHDLVVQKANGAPAGSDAVSVIGLPNTAGNGLGMVTVHGIACLANAYAASATNPWQTCVHITDPNFNAVWDVKNPDAGPHNGEITQGTAVRVTQTGSGASNYVDDSYYQGLEQADGFALVWLDGHVEGTHITDATSVGSAYGVYSPAWLDAGTSGAASAVWLGTDGLFVSNSHFNNLLRNIYAEGGTNVQADATDFFATYTNDADDQVAADATLPADSAVLNASLALHGYSYVGIDVINGNYPSVVGVSFYGTATGFSNFVRWDVLNLHGSTTAPTALVGGVFSDNSFQNLNGYAMHIGAAASNPEWTGNTAVTTSGYDVKATGGTHGLNGNNGQPVDFGMSGNTFTVAGSGIVSIPGGDLEVGGGAGAYGYLDLHFPGSLSDYDCREIVTPQGGAVPTATAGLGVMTWTCSGVNLSGAFTAKSLDTAGAVTSDTVGPHTTGRQMALGGSGGVAFSGAVQLVSAAKAQLPSGCTAGQELYVSDGRNPGEAAGAGTGTVAFCNKNAAWYAVSTGAAVTN